MAYGEEEELEENGTGEENEAGEENSVNESNEQSSSQSGKQLADKARNG